MKKRDETPYLAANSIVNIQCCTNFLYDASLDLSIIVPIYNAEFFLDNLLLCLFNQKTNYIYEIIFVDDGSTDLSYEKIKSFVDKSGGGYILKKENGGAASARNFGVKYAKGRYIAFVDSDDEISRDFVETMLSMAYGNKADLVRCNYVEFDIERKLVINAIHTFDFISEGFDEIRGMLPGFVWGAIYSRELWKNISFADGYWYEDIITRLVIYRECKKLCCCGKVLYRYNIHSEMGSKTKWKSSDLKSLDHVILLKSYLELGKEREYVFNTYFLKAVLYEAGPMMFRRIRRLKRGDIKNAFLYISEFFRETIIATGDLNLNEKMILKAYKRQNFFVWKLASIYWIVKNKI